MDAGPQVAGGGLADGKLAQVVGGERQMARLPLMQLRPADGAMGDFDRPAHRRQEDRQQRNDDRDDDEQFDKGETLPHCRQFDQRQTTSCVHVRQLDPS